jgi:hypothetical protein
MSERLLTARNVLALSGMAIVADQAAGFLHRQTSMSDQPSIEAQINPDSDRTILVAGGMGNDGIAVARSLGNNYLLNIGSILGIRYAQRNIGTKQLVDQVDRTIDEYGLRDNRFDVYLGSAAGVIMAEPLRELSKRIHLGTVILDGCPHSKDDVSRPFRDLLSAHLDVIKHSRIFNYLTHIASNIQMPPATDKAADIPLECAEANRTAIITADSITLGIQAAAIRRSVMPGLLMNTADEFVYVHSQGNDPLVDNTKAITGWGLIAQPLREVEDPYRSVNSHASGPGYPRGLVEILQGNL